MTQPIEPADTDQDTDAESPEDPASEGSSFRLSQEFSGGEISGALSLGPLESRYEELFAEALEDGVITQEERARLDKAADNMGLNRGRLMRLEQAMVQAYESHHRVKIVDAWDEAPQSLSPMRGSQPSDPGQAMLLKQIERLEDRIRTLEEELREARAHINVEVDVTGLESPMPEEDIGALRKRIRQVPLRREPYQALYRACETQGDVDGQFCASQVLVALQKADEAQLSFYKQHARRRLIDPLTSVSPTAWNDLLHHPEQELLTGSIFAVVAPAVLLGRVTMLRRDKKQYIPVEDRRQDLETTTVTAARALGWGAALLGLPVPNVYLDKDKEFGFEHVPGLPPFTVVGSQVLSGRRPLEHAFLAGRHLSYYRQEHFVKALFSDVSDLEDLFLAALLIGRPGLPIAESMRARVEPISKAIEPMLEPTQVDALRGHFMRFVEDGGRTNLMRWSQSVDKTACRAGLLLCDDLPTAFTCLGADPEQPSELAEDLCAFCAGERYAKLRKQLKIGRQPD